MPYLLNKAFNMSGKIKEKPIVTLLCTRINFLASCKGYSKKREVLWSITAFDLVTLRYYADGTCGVCALVQISYSSAPFTLCIWLRNDWSMWQLPTVWNKVWHILRHTDIQTIIHTHMHIYCNHNNIVKMHALMVVQYCGKQVHSTGLIYVASYITSDVHGGSINNIMFLIHYSLDTNLSIIICTH